MGRIDCISQVQSGIIYEPTRTS